MIDYDYITPELGTFALHTLNKRLPDVLRNVRDNNRLSTSQILNLDSIPNNLLNMKVQTLNFHPDEVAYWDRFNRNYVGKELKDIPFIFSEIYFYRLLNDVLGQNFDAFAYQKREELKLNSERSHLLLQKYINKEISPEEIFENCVLGNKADLSQDNSFDRSGKHQMLINDSKELFSDLPRYIHIILDNSGLELLTDLILAHYLISTYAHNKVVLHFKHYPTFVSDATLQDFNNLLDFISSKSSNLSFISEIKNFISLGRLTIADSRFWNSPVFFTQIPPGIIPNSDDSLIILKGDLNYRKLFHDKKIPVTEKIDFTNFLKPRIGAMRILKSEILTGLDAKKLPQVKKFGNWMTNGSFSIIQKLN